MTDYGFLDLRYENDETLGNIIRTRHCIETEYMDAKCSLETFQYQHIDEDWTPNYADIPSCDNGIFNLDM
jgi:hypothetical protein